MLEKQIVIGIISVLESGQIEVREDTVIYEDGVEISRTYMRYVLNPGDDTVAKPRLVQDIAVLAWTPEIIVAWKAYEESVKPKIPPPPPISLTDHIPENPVS